MAEAVERVPFIEPPRLTGEPTTDMANLSEWLWEFYNSAILSAGLLQPEELPDELTSQFPILANLGAIVGEADTVPYLTGVDTWAITAFTAYARSLVAAADAAAARTVLALGAVAVLNSIGTSHIDDDAVTYAKIQNVSATDRLLGRSSVGAGDVEEIVCTAAGRAILDDADAAAQRTTLGLGSGLSVTITTAKLTPAGSDGSMTFVNGILTAQTAAT